LAYAKQLRTDTIKRLQQQFKDKEREIEQRMIDLEKEKIDY